MLPYLARVPVATQTWIVGDGNNAAGIADATRNLGLHVQIFGRLSLDHVRKLRGGKDFPILISR
jgi:hypothetical protein